MRAQPQDHEPTNILEPAKRATFSTREAGGSIKPGARAPGSAIKKRTSPRSGRQRKSIYALSPAPRAHSLSNDSILGLAPQALCCHLLRRFFRKLQGFMLSPASQVLPQLQGFMLSLGSQVLPQTSNPSPSAAMRLLTTAAPLGRVNLQSGGGDRCST